MNTARFHRPIQFFIILLTAGCVKGTSTLSGQFSKLPPPKIVMLNALPSAVKGGSLLAFQFRSEAQSVHGVRTQFIEISLDGGATFSPEATLGGDAHTYQWRVPVVDVPEAVIQIRAVDNLGYESKNISSFFEIRSKLPLLTQDVSPALVTNNAPSINYGGQCVNGLLVKVERIDIQGNSEVLAETPCDNARWAFTATVATDGRYTFRFTENDSVLNEAEVRAIWDKDSLAPNILAGSFRLNGGAPSASFNYLFVDLEASDTSGNVTDFCFQFSNDNAAPTSAPGPNDSCWIAVNNPDQPNLPIRKTLSLKQFRYRIGFTPGTYYIDAWVRDSSFNASSPVRASIVYNPGTPPVVINAMATRTDLPTLPLGVAETTIAQNSPVYIRWKVDSAKNELGAGPVSLFTTTDDVAFTPIARGLENNQNNLPCSLGNGLSTGCYVWPSTFNAQTYFRIRVAVTDKNGMITVVSSNAVNAAGLNNLAGSTDQGIGGSATASIFNSERASFYNGDLGSFVVAKDGQVFFRDYEKGIYSVSSGDGILRLLLPQQSGADNTFEGRIVPGSTSLYSASKIALDFQDGLLIWDYDRIRRLDLKTMEISTVIGGGTKSGDGVGPKEVLFQPGNRLVAYALIPLPNGDLIFQSDNYGWSNKSRLRHYHKNTGLVDSINVTGNGHYGLGLHADEELEDLATCKSPVAGVPSICSFNPFGVEFSPTTSALLNLQVTVIHPLTGGGAYPLANLTPAGPNRGKSLAPHPPTPPGTGFTPNRFTGRNGLSYVLSKHTGEIHRFEKANNSWTKVLGKGGIGSCPDGTLAGECLTQPTDAFVDVQGNLFFLDRGRLRTIDANQKVVTVFGQSYFFGDGGLATSARFNIVPNIDRIRDGRIVVTDSVEGRLREFQPGGSIKTIAGNGGTQEVGPNDPASTSSFSVQSAGAVFIFNSVNYNNGDVFAANGTSGILRLDRATDRWVPLLNPINSYPPNILGFNGQEVLAHTGSFNSALGLLAEVRLRTVDLNGNVKEVVGSPEPSRGAVECPDGNVQAACLLLPSYASQITRAHFDSMTSRWLVHLINGTRIFSFAGAADGVVATLATLERPAQSFVPVRAADTTQTIYYCANDGRIYRRNIAAATETALEWRIPSMSCSGSSLLYDPARKSIIFPFIQLGLHGVAEYQLP